MPVASEKKKVLIVDDEADIVQLLRDTLGEAYAPIGVTRWTDAVDALCRERPDLILLDLKMPTIDGPSLLEFIRSQGDNVPVIVVSGFLTDQVTTDLSRLGVKAFIQKPFKPSEVRVEVRRALGQDVPQEDGASPVKMETLFASAGPSRPAATSAPVDADLIDVLKRLDQGQAGPSGPEPARTLSPSALPDEVLAALQRNVPPAGVPPAQPSPGVPPRTGPPPPASRPTFSGAASDGGGPFADALMGAAHPSSRPAETPGISRGPVYHRRRRPLSRRNVLFFGAMTLACVLVAGFLAVMRWYAGQVDVSEIKQKSRDAMTKQAVDELLRDAATKR